MTNQPPLFKPKPRHPKRKTPVTAAPQDRRDLEVEINTLRRAIDSLSQRIDEDGLLSEQLRLLDTLSSAAMRLSTLLKVQQGLGQSSEDYLTGLSRLLAEVHEEEGWVGVNKK